MGEINYEQYGVAALTIGILIRGIQLALSKVSKHEETIEELHKQHTDLLVNTLDSQNKSIATLDKIFQFIKDGEGSHENNRKIPTD